MHAFHYVPAVIFLAISLTVGWEKSINEESGLKSGRSLNQTTGPGNGRQIGQFTEGSIEYTYVYRDDVQLTQFSNLGTVGEVIAFGVYKVQTAYPMPTTQKIGAESNVIFIHDRLQMSLDFTDTAHDLWDAGMWMQASNALRRYFSTGQGRSLNRNLVEFMQAASPTHSTFSWNLKSSKAKFPIETSSGRIEIEGSFYQGYPLDADRRFACLEYAIQWANGHYREAQIGDIVKIFTCHVSPSVGPHQAYHPGTASLRIYSGRDAFRAPSPMTYDDLIATLQLYDQWVDERVPGQKLYFDANFQAGVNGAFGLRFEMVPGVFVPPPSAIQISNSSSTSTLSTNSSYSAFVATT